MASLVYTQALMEMMDGTIDIDTDTIKCMLVEDGYVPDQDDTVIDDGGGNDPIDHEISVSGYTGGFGGAGRKTVSIALTANDTNNRVDIGIEADLTWSSLGAGATIAGAILVKEITNDTLSRLIAYFDVNDFATTGGDYTLDFTPSASGGNIQFPL